jgi:hypothetical protein
MTELRDLESSENTGGLGVRFVEVKRGDRICESESCWLVDGRLILCSVI